MSVYQIDNCWSWYDELTVVQAVYNSYSARLFTAPRISEYAEQKRTKQNLIYAAVNVKR